jgi:hypothetical protein
MPILAFLSFSSTRNPCPAFVAECFIAVVIGIPGALLLCFRKTVATVIGGILFLIVNGFIAWWSFVFILWTIRPW